MTQDKNQSAPRTTAEYRAFMNDLIKKNTICGELVYYPTRIGDLLLRNGLKCSDDVWCANPEAKLEGIRNAIDKSAENFVSSSKKKAGSIAEILRKFDIVNEQEIGHLIRQRTEPEYKRNYAALLEASREVLGLKPYTPDMGEPKPDHGLNCVSANKGYSGGEEDLLGCSKSPTSPRERR